MRKASGRPIALAVPGVAAILLSLLVARGEARAEGAADAYAAGAFMIVHKGGHLGGAADEEGSTWRPVRGLVYRFSLDPPDFLDAVGRPDLAERERTRHRRSRTLSILGDVVTPLGLLTILVGLGASDGRIALAGVAATVGGAITYEVGESMRDPALPESEALRLAEGYNRALRVRLGLAGGAATVGGTF